ncbi:MAG TPA: phage regulatory CII family protein [Acetobacteraceae bacterium]|nr:phage regulatory CII family protein [Acetobacteraceae bacterium]
MHNRAAAAEADGFSRLAHRILVQEKVARLQGVATALGMSYANLYARVTGRVTFKPAEISRLIRAVPDQRLCEFLLRDSDFVAVRRPAAGLPGHTDVLHAATTLAEQALAIIAQTGAALAGGTTRPLAQEQIQHHVAAAEHALCTLRTGLPLLKSAVLLGAKPHRTGMPARTIAISPGDASPPALQQVAARAVAV